MLRVTGMLLNTIQDTPKDESIEKRVLAEVKDLERQLADTRKQADEAAKAQEALEMEVSRCLMGQSQFTAEMLSKLIEQAAQKHKALNHTAAELVVNTLDKRNGKTAVIHYAHPHRITRAFAHPPRRSLAVVNLVSERLKGSGSQQALDIGFQLAWIGDVGIAQTKGQFGGFHDAVNGHCLVGIGHRQTVGYPQDRQRHQPLRRRSQVPDLSLLVLQFQRCGSSRNVLV